MGHLTWGEIEDYGELLEKYKQAVFNLLVYRICFWGGIAIYLASKLLTFFY